MVPDLMVPDPIVLTRWSSPALEYGVSSGEPEESEGAPAGVNTGHALSACVHLLVTDMERLLACVHLLVTNMGTFSRDWHVFA